MRQASCVRARGAASPGQEITPCTGWYFADEKSRAARRSDDVCGITPAAWILKMPSTNEKTTCPGQCGDAIRVAAPWVSSVPTICTTKKMRSKNLTLNGRFLQGVHRLSSAARTVRSQCLAGRRGIALAHLAALLFLFAMGLAPRAANCAQLAAWDARKGLYKRNPFAPPRWILRTSPAPPSRLAAGLPTIQESSFWQIISTL